MNGREGKGERTSILDIYDLILFSTTILTIL